MCIYACIYTFMHVYIHICMHIPSKGNDTAVQFRLGGLVIYIYTSKGNDTKAGEIEPEEQIRELLLKLEEAVEHKEHTAAVQFSKGGLD